KTAAEISAQPIRIAPKAPPAKPQPVQEARPVVQAVQQPQAVQHQAPRAADPVADVIRASEAEAMHPAIDPANDSFQPKSTLFQPVPGEPALRPAPVHAAAPAPAAPARMPRVEDFPPVV